MHAHHRLITLMLIALSMTAATAVRGQELLEWWPREQHFVQSGGISLDQAAQMAQSRFNARVVKAETVRSGDRRVHQIRLLNAEGKVWTVRVDAQTGQMF